MSTAVHLLSSSYLLRAPLTAVRLTRCFDEQSKRVAIDIDEIPAGSTIQLSGYRYGTTSLIELVWNVGFYAVVEEDLLKALALPVLSELVHSLSKTVTSL